MWEIVWWHWAIAGFSLLVLDAVALNIYYLMWFGGGALATAAAAAIFPTMPTWVQIVLFSVLSLALLALWLCVLRPRQLTDERRLAMRDLPGQAGVVASYNAVEKCGTIRLQRPVGGKDVWEFISECPPRKGDRAVIQTVDADGIVRLSPSAGD